MNHIKKVEKGQKVKMVCLRIDSELITRIDKDLIETKITRTEWFHRAAEEFLQKQN